MKSSKKNRFFDFLGRANLCLILSSYELIWAKKNQIYLSSGFKDLKIQIFFYALFYTEPKFFSTNIPATKTILGYLKPDFGGFCL